VEEEENNDIDPRILRSVDITTRIYIENKLILKLFASSSILLLLLLLLFGRGTSIFL